MTDQPDAYKQTRITPRPFALREASVTAPTMATPDPPRRPIIAAASACQAGGFERRTFAGSSSIEPDGRQMDAAPDIANILVKAIARFSDSLESWLHIPWPTAVALLYLPVVGLLSAIVWYLRGTLFPIQCGYPTARGKVGCTRRVLGEWRKCWYHRKSTSRRTDGHTINPRRNRWEYYTNIDGLQAAMPVGRGFLRMRPGRDSFLYKRGFSRRPGQVLTSIPDLAKGLALNAARSWRQLRSANAMNLKRSTSETQVIGSSEVLPGVIQASRTVLAFAAFGLLLVGVAELLSRYPQLLLQFIATLCLVFALMCFRAGIFTYDEAWLRRSLRDTTRCMTSFTGIAAVGGLLELHGEDLRQIGAQVLELALPAVLMLIALASILAMERFDKRASAVISLLNANGPRKRRKR